MLKGSYDQPVHLFRRACRTCYNIRMSSRRILVLAGVLALAILIGIVGLQNGLLLRPPASTPPSTNGLWWPTPSGELDRAGGPPNPRLTTIPFQSTQTEAARLTQHLATTTAIGANFGQSTSSLIPSPGLPAGLLDTPQPLEPSPTTNPLACLPPGAADDPGGDILPVSWVLDGASFVVDRQGLRQTVRLIGVDAPPIAARKLEELVGNQIVRLISDPIGPDADTYGQLLRYVLTLDGTFINIELLHQGQAKLDKTAGFSCQDQFALAEDFAKTAQIGMWGVMAIAQLPTQTRVPTPTGPLTPVALQLTATAAASGSNPTATAATPTTTPTTSGTPATVTATTGAAGTPTATPSGKGETDGQVAIINIFYLGTASKGESDEYIEIKNVSSTPAVLTGWSLWSDETAAERYFPDFTLQPGATCRLYTNEVHPDSCAGISFDQDTEAWDNEFGCGGLYDPDEEWIAGYCYPPDNWQP